jgi:hypothetical protein
MGKTFEKAVTGFNHNIKHKGKIYHVQTEDSGVNNPHIITHLFVGGNILASKKSSYADRLGLENLAAVVRELMEEQHKQMLRNLIHGAYENLDNRAQSYQPGELAAQATGPGAGSAASAAGAATTAAASSAAGSSLTTGAATSAAASSAAGSSLTTGAATTAPAAPFPASEANASAEPVPAAAPSALGSPLEPPSTMPHGIALPPPAGASVARVSPELAPQPAHSPGGNTESSSAGRAEEVIDVDALFGGDSFGDPSLDEVILRYLAQHHS